MCQGRVFAGIFQFSLPSKHFLSFKPLKTTSKHRQKTQNPKEVPQNVSTMAAAPPPEELGSGDFPEWATGKVVERTVSRAKNLLAKLESLEKAKQQEALQRSLAEKEVEELKEKLKKVEEELEEEKKTTKWLNDEWKETEYFLEEEEKEKTQENQKGKRFAGALAKVVRRNGKKMRRCKQTRQYNETP